MVDTSDSVKAHWKHLQQDTKYIKIGYVRKLSTDETKESQIRLWTNYTTAKSAKKYS